MIAKVKKDYSSIQALHPSIFGTIVFKGLLTDELTNVNVYAVNN